MLRTRFDWEIKISKCPRLKTTNHRISITNNFEKHKLEETTTFLIMCLVPTTVLVTVDPVIAPASSTGHRQDKLEIFQPIDSLSFFPPSNFESHVLFNSAIDYGCWQQMDTETSKCHHISGSPRTVLLVTIFFRSCPFCVYHHLRPFFFWGCSAVSGKVKLLMKFCHFIFEAIYFVKSSFQY